MRSDYPNSDLINRVNSEWINKVLVHPELCRADSVDDDYDDDDHELALRDDVAWEEAPSMRHEPVQVLADLRELPHPESGLAVRQLARMSRPRSIARRVSERLALAVAALGFGAAAWMAPGAQEAPDLVSVGATNAAPEKATPTDTATRMLVEPAWFAPEILYATAIAPPAQYAVAPALPRAGR